MIEYTDKSRKRKMRRSAAPRMPKASLVKIIKADGSIEVQKPYISRKQMNLAVWNNELGIQGGKYL